MRLDAVCVTKFGTLIHVGRGMFL